MLAWIKKHRTEAILGLVFAIVFAPFPDFVLRPFLAFIASKFVYLITVFSTTLSDQIYQEIAKGETNALLAVTAAIVAICSTTFLLSNGVTSIQLASGQSNLAHLLLAKGGTEENPRPNRNRTLPLLRAFVFLLGISALVGMTLITLYQGTASIRIRQYIAANERYLTDQEIKVYNSRAATLRNSQDFDSLIDDLRANAKKYGIVLD